MKYLFFIAAISSVLFISCQKESATSSPETEVSSAVVNSTFNVNTTLMLQLVNNIRKSGCNCGSTSMPPVAAISWNDLLGKAAYEHSLDMQTKNYFDHTGLNGSTPGNRVTKAGYIWKAFGENIAKGHTSETEVINGWINSEGHCKNIMSPNFKEMGAGRAGSYWTQEFGSR